MAKVLVTGMSGTGKSYALHMLGEKGHRVVDTDVDEWSEWVTAPDGSQDWVWRKDAITSLLNDHRNGHLFVSGCKTNQGKFYPLFDHIVLLSSARRCPSGKDRITHRQPVREGARRASVDLAAPRRSRTTAAARPQRQNSMLLRLFLRSSGLEELAEYLKENTP